MSTQVLNALGVSKYMRSPVPVDTLQNTVRWTAGVFQASSRILNWRILGPDLARLSHSKLSQLPERVGSKPTDRGA